MPVTIVGNNTPTAGGVVYGDGTNYASSAAGTSGQLLQSNGSSAPSWVAAPTSSFVYIASTTANNSSTVDLNTGFSSSYDNYYILFQNCTTSSAGSDLGFQIYLAGVVQTGSVYNSQSVSTAALSSSTSSASSGRFGIAMNTDASNEVSTGYLNVFDVNNTRSRNPQLSGYAARSDAATARFTSMLYASATTSAITGIRFISVTGNIVTGTFRLYGIKNS